MSWKFGGIYLKNSFNNDPTLALNRLDIDKRPCYERIPFADTVEHFFEPVAVGMVGKMTLIHNRAMAYDHSYQADTYSPADHRLLVLSREVENIVFYFDGSTNSYGLSHFKAGKRVRHFSQLSGEVIVEEGDFTTNHPSAEDNMFDWLNAFTGLSFDQLMADEQPIMSLFTETGF